MKSIARLGFLLATLCFVSCTTTRYKEPPSLEEQFKKADVNGDGRISRDEFANFMVAEAFSRIDKNHDGFVTEEEFLEAGGTVETFRKMDINSDGRITLKEATLSPVARKTMTLPFDGADLDGSGYVTWAEFQAYRAKAQPYIR